MPQFNSSPKSSSDSKNFLKLKDRDSVTGVFRGDVHEFFVQWKDKKPVESAESAPGAKFRFRVNFVCKENGALVSKIFEQGAVVYNLLKDLSLEYELDSTFVKVIRNGSGMNDTTYSILPLIKQTVTPEIEKQLAAVPLQELAPKSTPETKEHHNEFDENEEVPF